MEVKHLKLQNVFFTVIIDDIYHSRLADEPLPQAHLCILVDIMVAEKCFLLQIVSKWNIFIKRPYLKTYHALNCFLKMCELYL